MAEEYIIIGSSEGKLASHASTIDTLVIAYKDGTAEEREYRTISENPGQEIMQFVDSNFPEAKAVITKEMTGPPNYSKRAIIKESEESIAEIVEKYNTGEYDPEIDKYSLEEKAEEAGIPKRDGSGKGERDNKGRGGCPPEEQEEYGKGSGKKEGRAEEGSPKGDYESEKTYESGETESEGSSASGESSGDKE
ncbi:hypothetical protein KY345_06570 [Candidatus Woesearchaeota archaeon]|nr:hypothetical protein [Candidatus Woesearchaeota archaeon]